METVIAFNDMEFVGPLQEQLHRGEKISERKTKTVESEEMSNYN